MSVFHAHQLLLLNLPRAQTQRNCPDCPSRHADPRDSFNGCLLLVPSHTQFSKLYESFLTPPLLRADILRRNSARRRTRRKTRTPAGRLSSSLIDRL
ncbi:hypothetical protein BD626DRAFT_33398 [Schizophyllum amplum]|uniref:Uncharacterized protein n=1 Tax=Schizophyllum amplum TaxID=97359 RepID=A0A550CEB2_9AGAR|nr:hypothetical protein BD626DRAFT_33398 [Auriculariopsis ampla]